VRFGLLGTLALTDDADRSVAVPGARQRVLLASLLLSANTPLSLDALAEVVWDGSPPASAAVTLRSHVKRLRRALGPEAGVRLTVCEPGYRISVRHEHELDVLGFEAACRDAAAARRAGRWPEAAAGAARALALWRGAPLLDIPSQLLRDQCVPALEQLHLQALEDRAEAGLRLGRHDDLVADLRDLAARYPVRERFHGQLMEALARAGRQAEALEVFRRVRDALVAELGIEPGPAVQLLQRQILAGDPAVAPGQVAAGGGPRPADPAVALRQLPAAAEHLTGRQSELDWLAGLAGDAGTHPGTVVIAAIDGMAGIGKTALAVHAAHRLAGQFPDGQLFLDLHGYTQGHPPRSSSAALEWLLQALDVAPDRIPPDGDQAAALYRQRLAGTRTLIVLDNAADEAQLRPLLPGGGSCLVIVTSRKRLKALDDARPVSLDLLTPPGAVALLRAVAGPGRIPPGDPLAGEVARLCGYLPLALRIAASLLRHRPAWTLEDVAGQLRDQRQRVGALSDGERRLPEVFGLSYASLDDPHRRLWRYLGLIPGPDLDVYAAAALTACDRQRAAGLLEDLVDDNVLEARPGGRYRLHDLLCAYARGLAAADPRPERAAAVDRLLGYYAHTAQCASVLIANDPRPWPGGPAPAHAPALRDPETALAWLRTERPNLDAAFALAHAGGVARHTVALARGLAEILFTDGAWSRALQVHEAAAEAAACSGDTAGQAAALTDAACVRGMTGDYPGAGEAYARALELYCALGSRLGEAGALTGLGRVRTVAADYAGAGEAHLLALAHYRSLGYRLGEANALTDLGRVRALTGDYHGAGDAHTRALEIFRELGNRGDEAYALNNYAATLGASGQRSRALALYQEALAMHRELNKPDDEAVSLEGIAEHHPAAGDHVRGAAHLDQALEIYQRLVLAPTRDWPG
jgi:DNA-binding SARP family transcriptional activator